MREFKSSEGSPASLSLLPAERMHRLRATKAKLLGMIWSYLYSGREEEAGACCNEMWPTGDVGRIRAETTEMHTLAESALKLTVNPKNPQSRRKKHAQIFDAVSREQSGGNLK